jgi:hypothetical protein
MSFIVENEITIVGMFSQNGFQTIKLRTPVDIVFDNAPGRIYHAKITGIPKGIGQGQIAASGTLARTTALGGASAFPAVISVPDEMSRDSLRLGMSGNATAFSEKRALSASSPPFWSGSAPTPHICSQRLACGSGKVLSHGRSGTNCILGHHGIEQPAALTVAARPRYARITEFSQCCALRERGPL